MSQLVGIGILLVCVAVILLLPRQQWPRAPTWMRVTAAAIALALVFLAVVLVEMAEGGRDSPGGLVVVALAGASAVLALRLIVWAWVGRVNPRSILATLSPDVR